MKYAALKDTNNIMKPFGYKYKVNQILPQIYFGLLYDINTVIGQNNNPIKLNSIKE
jgi:hypothetical protein